ncbi:hypothetical protein QE152_g33638 [Popillia japonica]|uniref:Uncharacterized protein n=1 Tax=Popillia japonica TaxID=7064 RepID=A0AAW1IW30_POPJA
MIFCIASRPGALIDGVRCIRALTARGVVRNVSELWDEEDFEARRSLTARGVVRNVSELWDEEDFEARRYLPNYPPCARCRYRERVRSSPCTVAFVCCDFLKILSIFFERSSAFLPPQPVNNHVYRVPRCGFCFQKQAADPIYDETCPNTTPSRPIGLIRGTDDLRNHHR